MSDAEELELLSRRWLVLWQGANEEFAVSAGYGILLFAVSQQKSGASDELSNDEPKAPEGEKASESVPCL